jgi:hypothetical protein
VQVQNAISMPQSTTNLIPRCSFRWLHKPLETAEPNYFSRIQTHGFVYTLRMNIFMTVLWSEWNKDIFDQQQ